MRLPCIGITVRRLMLAVFVIGVCVGGTIELDRASTRRTAYLDRAFRADWLGQGRRSLARDYEAQAVATRAWVAAGAQCHPPGELVYGIVSKGGYTFGQDEAEAWRRRPELAISAAKSFEQTALRLDREATDLARRRRECERAARYPRVLFAPNPPSSPRGSDSGGLD